MVGEFTIGTQVIMSFGSAFGGFEFAMQLRYDIMQSVGMRWDEDPAFVYLDAESPKNQKNSSYPWDQMLGIYKMQNPFWQAFYEGALDNACNMIFLLTEQWLTSQYCWEELRFFLDRFESNPNIRPIFVVFPDAVGLLNQAEITLRDNTTRKPSAIWNEMKAVPDSKTVHILTPPDNSLQTIVVEGEEYQYHYNYMCSEDELNATMGNLNLRTVRCRRRSKACGWFCATTSGNTCQYGSKASTSGSRTGRTERQVGSTSRRDHRGGRVSGGRRERRPATFLLR